MLNEAERSPSGNPDQITIFFNALQLLRTNIFNCLIVGKCAKKQCILHRKLINLVGMEK